VYLNLPPCLCLAWPGPADRQSSIYSNFLMAKPCQQAFAVLLYLSLLSTSSLSLSLSFSFSLLHLFSGLPFFHYFFFCTAPHSLRIYFVSIRSFLALKKAYHIRSFGEPRAKPTLVSVFCLCRPQFASTTAPRRFNSSPLELQELILSGERERKRGYSGILKIEIYWGCLREEHCPGRRGRFARDPWEKDIATLVPI
jgi:hypothetical protein